MKKIILTNEELGLLSPNELDVLEYIDGKLSGEKIPRPDCLAKDFDVQSVLAKHKKEVEENAKYAEQLEAKFV